MTFQFGQKPLLLISDESGSISMTIGDAVSKGIIRHPTVGYFMGWTMDFLTNVGINPEHLRFQATRIR
jgi:glycyl-tRNA synthetase